MKNVLERYPTSAKNDFFFHVNLSPSEIYSSDMDGTNIERLSEHSGFDAFPALLEKKDRLFFSRWENETLIFLPNPRKDI